MEPYFSANLRVLLALGSPAAFLEVRGVVPGVIAFLEEDFGVGSDLRSCLLFVRFAVGSVRVPEVCDRLTRGGLVGNELGRNGAASSSGRRSNAFR